MTAKPFYLGVDLLLFVLMVAALLGMGLYLTNLRRIAKTAPVIGNACAPADATSSLPGVSSPLASSIAVVVPAYNEAINICDCIQSVLASAPMDTPLTLWVVDDQSEDATLALAQALQQALQDFRFHVLPGQARPQGEGWRGKNWACAQGAQHTESEYLLFLDADVRLKPGAIAAACQAMEQTQADLLTVIPQIECGFWGEWLIQPLIMGLLVAGFDFTQVNDPASSKAFAAGPFMCFRRSAYDRLGGHRAVANCVVEDVELARRIKQKGMTLRFAIGHPLASVRMYRTWQGIWEGWTKNWHEGSQRNLGVTLFSALIPFLVGVVPWVGGIVAVWQVISGQGTLETEITGAIALGVIGLQWEMRRQLEPILGIPPRYWWLTGIGAIFTIAIILMSIVKAETGWGWTWRGRSL